MKRPLFRRIQDWIRYDLSLHHYFFLFIIGLIVFLSIFGPSACTRPAEATRVLEQSGYSEVEITGWRPFMGDKGDSFSTGFRAKSPNGSKVTGAVTSGIFKGNTIRLD